MDEYQGTWPNTNRPFGKPNIKLGVGTGPEIMKRCEHWSSSKISWKCYVSNALDGIENDAVFEKKNSWDSIDDSDVFYDFGLWYCKILKFFSYFNSIVIFVCFFYVRMKCLQMLITRDFFRIWRSKYVFLLVINQLCGF